MVVAVIGVMVAVVGVQLSRDVDRLANLEAQRFTLLVNEARDEAIISGQSYALLIEDKAATYHFELISGRDKDSAAVNLFAPRILERGVSIRTRVFQSEADADLNWRTVLICPLGEITPFEIEFSGDEHQYPVVINNEGALERLEPRRL